MSSLEEQLPCGADLQALVRQVFDGERPRDLGHQAGCPHCQDALTRLEAVHETVGSVAAEPVTAPPGLVSEVMQQLRRDDDGVLVGADSRGTVTVTEHIVTQVARRAAFAGSDVTFASVALVDDNRVAPLRLSVRLVVVFGPSLQEVAEAVRQRIQRAVEGLAGVPVSEVDVFIDDLA